MFRLVSDNWEAEVTQARSDSPRGLLMVCPFIKDGTTKRLLSDGEARSMRVITRFDLSGFYDGVSDTSALRRLLDAGAKIRGVKRLHAKLFLFGKAGRDRYECEPHRWRHVAEPRVRLRL